MKTKPRIFVRFFKQKPPNTDVIPAVSVDSRFRGNDRPMHNKETAIVSNLTLLRHERFALGSAGARATIQNSDLVSQVAI